MHKRDYIITVCARYICLLFIFAIILNFMLLQQPNSNIASHSKLQAEPLLRVLLIPLDSRPPCRDFPGQLARIANIQTITPPAGYLDNYRRPADTAALSDWLIRVGPSADAVIISTDALIHGGLLASRIPTSGHAEAEQVLNVIEQFHQHNPLIPIYVFNIIPRLYIADTPENSPHVKNMAELSILSDKLSQTFNADDYQQLTALRKEIPPLIQQRYEDMYEVNAWLGQRLLELAEQGTLAHVVLGQDDAQTYGMANMVKTRLQNWLSLHPNVRNATITRGTDEVAATLIARILTDYTQRTPRIFVHYSWPGAEKVIMPYMPVSAENTIQEKIALINGQRVSKPEDADFILYVHIGTPDCSPALLTKAAFEVKSYQQQGYPVALVDLSSKYDPSKNLFPYLERGRVDLTKLITYAGWNTLSNSIGTAVSHATIYSYAKHANIAAEESHLAFLFQRYLDDWYFQKQIQPKLNSILSTLGLSTTNLGINYTKINRAVEHALAYHANSLYLRHFAGRTVGAGLVTDYAVFIQLPWSRTFEVQVDTSLTTKVPSYQANQ